MNEPEAPTANAPELAVALSWDGTRAPRVSARGRGELAARIVALAQEHDVAINHDPVLVSLLADVELGDTVPETLFTAVAEVIAFAYRVRGNAPATTAVAGKHTSDR